MYFNQVVTEILRVTTLKIKILPLLRGYQMKSKLDVRYQLLRAVHTERKWTRKQNIQTKVKTIKKLTNVKEMF